jgi:hypothetical protein
MARRTFQVSTNGIAEAAEARRMFKDPLHCKPNVARMLVKDPSHCKITTDFTCLQCISSPFWERDRFTVQRWYHPPPPGTRQVYSVEAPSYHSEN